MSEHRIHQDITETMGDTPLIALRRLTAGLSARVIIKHEGFNPFSSVKDRIGTAMIDDAIQHGALRPRHGDRRADEREYRIGLAYAAAARGFRCIFVMPESMTIERRTMLRALGCRVVLTEGPLGTGGTITGAGRYLREKKADIRIVAVEPAESPVLSGGQPSPHKPQGIGPGFIPGNLDVEIYDEVIRVTNEDAIATTRRLAREEAIFAGISSGSITWAALELAGRAENEGKMIVSIICDFGERYLSNPVYSEMEEVDFSDLDAAVV